MEYGLLSTQLNSTTSNRRLRSGSDHRCWNLKFVVNDVCRSFISCKVFLVWRLCTGIHRRQKVSGCSHSKAKFKMKVSKANAASVISEFFATHPRRLSWRRYSCMLAHRSLFSVTDTRFGGSSVWQNFRHQKVNYLAGTVFNVERKSWMKGNSWWSDYLW